MQNITRRGGQCAHYNTDKMRHSYIFSKWISYNNVECSRAANVLLWSRQLFAPSSFWRLYLGALKATSFSHSLTPVKREHTKNAQMLRRPPVFCSHYTWCCSQLFHVIRSRRAIKELRCHFFIAPDCGIVSAILICVSESLKWWKISTSLKGLHE